MATKGGPPGKGGKPFLGEDDLLSELDAWDATFDALHGGPEGGTLEPPPAPMDWPAPTVEKIDPTTLSRPATDFDARNIDLDDQMTLDGALDGATQDAGLDTYDNSFARAQSVTVATEIDPDPLETDFSDVGASGRPQTLGDLLGRGSSSSDVDLDGGDEHDGDVDRTRISSPAPSRPSRAATPRPGSDDEVFTSASRPMRAPSDPSATFDDDIAPPPVPEGGRRTAAIVRRVTAPQPAVNRDVTPSRGVDVSQFAEETRVLHNDEVEGARAASRAYPIAAPVVDEDAYDDIEIDAKSDDEPSERQEGSQPLALPRNEGSSPAPLPRTRTAHVVRRADTPTKPPPVVGRESGPIIEMEMADVTPRPRAPIPDAEDDFSDVAAAVGASDDPLAAALNGLDEPPVRPSAPRTKPPGPPPARTTPPPMHAVPPQPLDLPQLPNFDDEDDADTAAPSNRTVISAPADDLVRQSRRHAVPVDEDAPVKTLILQAREEDVSRTRVEPESNRPPALADFYPRVKTPTSVPPLGMIEQLLDGDRPSRTRLQTPISAGEPTPEGPEPLLDLDGVGRDWPEQAPLVASTTLDESSAAALLVYEREVATLDDSAASAALRIEAGRLCERLSDLERARMHYDAALLADPRATAALRGLRRIARASGDLAEVTRHLDTEIAVAGALERRPLSHYRIDLLMASGEQDLARVAAGEILDSAPSDIRALLAQLELAFLDGRADEFGVALEQIASAVSDHELRAAVQSARGALAAHHNDTAAAGTWFAAAAESDPQGLASRLGTVRHAAAQADGVSVSRALIDVARQVEANDPITAAAAAIRAQQWAATTETPDIELIGVGASIATNAAPSDPLVARLSAEASSGEFAAHAYGHWAAAATSPAERAYAAARAAELDPARAAELWSIAIAHEPDDDYAAAQLRTSHVAAESTQAAIDVDLAIARDPERDRARLRAAYGLIAYGQLDAAIDVLAQGRAERPTALAISEALGEAYAAAGKWTERAELLAELAKEPGEMLDADIAGLRSAIAWEEAVGAAAQTEGNPDLQRLVVAALAAWDGVLEKAPEDPAGHAAAMILAGRLGDRDVLAEVLARAEKAAAGSPSTALAAASLAFRRARLFADDPERTETILRDTQALDDPRRTVALVIHAARSKELADATAALEERANQLDAKSTEVASLRLRAAQLALDTGDAAKATRLLQQVEQALPTVGVISDLLTAARRRAGDRPTAQTRRSEPVIGASNADAFVRVVRDADLAHQQGDAQGALGLYQRALELRPGDPLAAVPLVRVATELGDAAPLTALALAQLRVAEGTDDGGAKAAAYERIAQIDGEIKNDAGSAQIALESASAADPSRIDLLHRLERGYATGDEFGELLRLRRSELTAVPDEHKRDRAALLLDVAGLAELDNQPEIELAEIYRAVLDTEPNTRLALLHLESIVRRAGASEELSKLEEQIASYFEGDPKTQAAFWTRAGETLAEIGKIDEAVQRFGKAESALPGHIPALEGWRQAALKGALWIDVAEAATRQAMATQDEALRATYHHFAGVALMDKALVAEQAMAAFRRALEADPRHRDSFLRMRILLEEDANHDDLATLLANRLDFEDDLKTKIELHRALAELHRNFLSDRETAVKHYRAILDYDPNDLRSHAAVADIAWEQGNWQDAADALMARARLEREPEVLKTLCFRLGLIYADRLVDAPMALKAFQRALTYQPDDENTLARLADLAAQIGEWKLALGACERLVKNESDADRRVAHLHRVAKIFKDGFNDSKRAERALNLALDSSPTNDDALNQLVQFYKDARDMTSVRVHLNRVAGTMRNRLAQNPTDGVPYRVIARAMSARHQANTPGSLPLARAAAQLADMLGAAGEPEKKLLDEPARPDLSQMVRPEADDVVFPRGIQVELRQIFQLLGDRIAKHVGVNVQAYGVSRGDRVRAKDSPVAAVAQSVASGLGFGDIDVYVSSRQPWVMVAEPTSPVSLVIGSSIASAGGDAIKFAAGGALKLAQASLAIPARLPPDELGVLVVALLRLFQPDFPAHQLDNDAVSAQFQKLRRLIPTNLMNELRPFGLAMDPQRFSAKELSRDLKLAQLRAGLVASGSLMAGLRILAAQADAELPAFLADPVALGLVSFALSEDHAAVAR